MKRLMCVLLAGASVALALAPALHGQDKLPESAYYPVQVGTTWHYKVGEGKFSTRVTKHEKVGDVLTARLETSKDGKVIAVEHVGVGAEGVVRHDIEDNSGQQALRETLVPPILILKVPPKSGETWKVDSKGQVPASVQGGVGGPRVYRGTFKLGEEEVKVPAGTYKAVRVASQDLEANGLKPTVTTYYAEGVGMVKQVIQEGEVKIITELEKFEPGK
jgi:hypothetical protein